tara:strand:- start:608 stop:907 length:300 start_codon:yes stop_codon:yes gene_type:complete
MKKSNGKLYKNNDGVFQFMYKNIDGIFVPIIEENTFNNDIVKDDWPCNYCASEGVDLKIVTNKSVGLSCRECAKLDFMHILFKEFGQEVIDFATDNINW